MRRVYLSIWLILTGVGFLIGAMANATANSALGNRIEGAFLLELLAAGLGGGAATIAGIILLILAMRTGDYGRTIAPLTAPQRELVHPVRVSWSAWAFLALIVLLALVYMALVFLSSGMQGLLLQAVFFVPIIVVVLVLAAWWSKMASGRNELPPTAK